MSMTDEVMVLTDHKNLEYFNSTKILNRRQHRWAESLQPFWFKVVYREECLNEKADVLSWRRAYRPEEGGEPLEIPQKFFSPGQYEQVPDYSRMLFTSGQLAKMSVLKLPSTMEEK